VSHHGREDEREECNVSWHEIHLNRYGSAVELIKALASGFGEDGHNGQFATTSPKQACNAWLERHGFDCEATRRRERERRAIEIDAEIERLRAERAKL
jgi:hypothetical protein